MNVWIYENVYFGLMHVLTAGELTGAEGRVRVEDPDKRPDADVIDYNRHHSPKSSKREVGKIGLAKLPLDRFIAQRAGDTVGTITKKPFKLEGNHLANNTGLPENWPAK